MAEKIGVFDSGIGGLTVMKALREAFPGLDMVYLGDLARVPYGGRSAETITRYALSDADFLMRGGVSAVIAACNTVSAIALEELRRRLAVPVYGVLECAAEQAAAATRSGTVGVIGTRATIASGAYERALLAKGGALRVLTNACPLLVPLVENGIAPDDPVAETICERYLRPFRGQGMDVLILGCTHYPVYRTVLQRLLPGVRLINSGEALAEQLRPLYGRYAAGSGHVDYYVTERSVAFDEIVRIMDDSVDAAAIHVDNSFL